MSNKHLLWVFLVALILGCSPKLSFNEEMLVDRFDYEFLTAKAKIRFESNEQKLNGSVNIRMRRDSAIWLSVAPGINIEVARILIVKDSIWVIDKIQKRFYEFGFAELSKTYDFDLSFGLIQSVLLGNLVFPYTKDDLVSRDGSVLIKQRHDSVVIDHFIGAISKKLEQINVFDQRSSSSIGITYADFKPVEAEILAHLIQAKLENKADPDKSVFLEVNYNKAQISDKQLKFPFNVPGRFQD